jgi:glutaredoxin
MNRANVKKAIIYRMVIDNHICPYGLKAKDLLRRQGYEIEDRWLTRRKQVDEFKEKHQVKTTPQIFINDERIGGYDDLQRYFGKNIR